LEQIICKFYSLKLKAVAIDEEFDDEKPEYDDGWKAFSALSHTRHEDSKIHEDSKAELLDLEDAIEANNSNAARAK